MQVQGLRFQARSMNRFAGQKPDDTKRQGRYDTVECDTYQQAVDRSTGKGGVVFKSGNVWWLSSDGWEDAVPGSREEQEARQIVSDAFS